MHQLVQPIINWFASHMFIMLMCVFGIGLGTWQIWKRALMFADNIEDELARHSGAYFIFLIVATIMSFVVTLFFTLSFLILLIKH